MKWSVTGLGGVASCMAVARVGTCTAIAVGCGDKTIRTVLTESEAHVAAPPVSACTGKTPSQKDFQRMHWQNIPNKVWHEVPFASHVALWHVALMLFARCVTRDRVLASVKARQKVGYFLVSDGVRCMSRSGGEDARAFRRQNLLLQNFILFMQSLLLLFPLPFI